ncbi:hypothetical protein OSTOST_19344 [Ostertagia ostertagi]
MAHTAGVSYINNFAPFQLYSRLIPEWLVEYSWCVTSVLWSLKLLDYMRVFRQLGPYITMAAEMIPRMLPILAMLFVSLLSFGLVREAITYPYENWHWLLLRNIFYKPYFMLYGEVYAPEIDVCGDEMWEAHIEADVPIGSDTLNITGEFLKIFHSLSSFGNILTGTRNI